MTFLGVFKQFLFSNDNISIPGKKTFEIAKALKPLEVEALGPRDAGLPIFIERSLPMVVALKVSK